MYSGLEIRGYLPFVVILVMVATEAFAASKVEVFFFPKDVNETQTLQKMMESTKTTRVEAFSTSNTSTSSFSIDNKGVWLEEES